MDNLSELIDKLPIPLVLHDKSKVIHFNTAFSNLLVEQQNLAALDFMQWLADSIKNQKDCNLLTDAFNSNSEITIKTEGYMKGVLHHWVISSSLISSGSVSPIYRLTCLQDTSASYFAKSYWDLHLRVNKATMQLIKEIDERKKAEAKAATLHAQLVTAARRAGMADIATSVLHNVGNVLNSVNTSTSIVHDKIRFCKLSNLTNFSAILQQYLTEAGLLNQKESKGQQLLEYITLLAAEWDGDKNAIVEELNRLNNNIDHINKIITTQQSLSGAVGLSEEAYVENLMQDAIMMHKVAYERAKIEIICDYKFNKKINVDKTKLLQILSNLIKNSIDSLLESESKEKKIIICVQEEKDAQFSIRISDNGVGVISENITKIFSYGFTTKKNGHGFGLHMSAISAKEMGGKLIVESEGKDKGATFILTLPVSVPIRRNDNEPKEQPETYSDR